MPRDDPQAFETPQDLGNLKTQARRPRRGAGFDDDPFFGDVGDATVLGEAFIHLLPQQAVDFLEPKRIQQHVVAAHYLVGNRCRKKSQR